MDADLREDGVDRPDLDATAAGAVAELCGLEVIVAVWREEGERGEAFDDGFLVPGSVEALKELKTLARAAQILGMRVQIELVDR